MSKHTFPVLLCSRLITGLHGRCRPAFRHKIVRALCNKEGTGSYYHQEYRSDSEKSCLDVKSTYNQCNNRRDQHRAESIYRSGYSADESPFIREELHTAGNSASISHSKAEPSDQPVSQNEKRNAPRKSGKDHSCGEQNSAGHNYLARSEFVIEPSAGNHGDRSYGIGYGVNDGKVSCRQRFSCNRAKMFGHGQSKYTPGVNAAKAQINKAAGCQYKPSFFIVINHSFFISLPHIKAVLSLTGSFLQPYCSAEHTVEYAYPDNH